MHFCALKEQLFTEKQCTEQCIHRAVTTGSGTRCHSSNSEFSIINEEELKSQVTYIFHYRPLIRRLWAFFPPFFYDITWNFCYGMAAVAK